MADSLEGTYNDPANTNLNLSKVANSRIIPSFLFEDSDPSEFIFDYIINQPPNIAAVFNTTTAVWPEICSDPEQIFGDASVLGTFVGCLLYANVTRDIANGSLVTNLTDSTFVADNSTAISNFVRSTYTTCLSGFCAGQAECAADNICNVGNLLTSNYELSAHGVAKCWLKLCTKNVQTANTDIAGVGIMVSYLTQSAIAIFGLLSLAILGYGVYRAQKKMAKEGQSRVLTGLTLHEGSSNPKKPPKTRKTVEDHYIVWCATLAEFHKAQCYFVIALQVATFVITYSKTTPVINVDQEFLLMVAVDGGLPVTLTLYTLMTFGKRSWYMIGLSIISVVMSTFNGTHITRNFSSYTDVKGLGPATCGGVGPAGLCYGLGANNYILDTSISANDYFLIMSIVDICAGCLVIWKILTESTNWWSVASTAVTSRMAKILAPLVGQIKPTNGLPADKVRRFNKINRLLQLSITIFLHFAIIALLLCCMGLEFFLFQELLTSPYVDTKSWGFGQIVGITIWMGVILELVYLEWNGIEEGLEWRLPKWIKVEEHEDKPGHLVITMEEMEFGQQGNNSDTMNTNPKTAYVSVGEEVR